MARMAGLLGMKMEPVRVGDNYGGGLGGYLEGESSGAAWAPQRVD